MPRARVVIVDVGRVALIERVREGRTYYLFPGGGVEPGETPEDGRGTVPRTRPPAPRPLRGHG